MMMYGLIAVFIFIVIIIVVLMVIMARGTFYRKDRQVEDWKGQASSPLAPPTVYPEPSTAATVMTCPNCGAALQADWTTCPQCGAPIEKPMGD